MEHDVEVELFEKGFNSPTPPYGINPLGNLLGGIAKGTGFEQGQPNRSQDAGEGTGWVWLGMLATIALGFLTYSIIKDRKEK